MAASSAAGLSRIASVEEAVLDQVEHLAGAGYHLQRRVLVGGPGKGAGMGLDGLLVHGGPGPDVLVEIKLATLRVRPESRANAGLAEARTAIRLYGEITERQALAWVIVVTERPSSMAQRVDIEQRLKEPDSGLFISVIPEAQLSELRLPFIASA
jgi:hypothetical protein